MGFEWGGQFSSRFDSKTLDLILFAISISGAEEMGKQHNN